MTAFALQPLQNIPELKDANDLIFYASTLALKGEVVKIGKEGLVVTGPELQGDWVRKPGDAMARAVEIYTEYAGGTKSMEVLADVIQTQDRENKTSTLIPYLRLFAKQNPATAFGNYCQVELAQAYLKTGDEQAALEVLQPFAQKNASDQEVAYAKAILARYYCSKGSYQPAKKLADEVVSAMQAGFLHKDSGQGYLIAQSVLALLPVDLRMAPATDDQKVTTQETLEKNLADNPRLYLALAETAQAKGDKQTAIQYWQEFTKRLPSEAVPVSMKIAANYADLKQYDKAISAYSSISIQYPETPEAWKSVLEAAKILQLQKQPKLALDLIITSIPKAKTPEAIAQLLHAAAVGSLKNNDAKSAANFYVQLLTRYGDQDGAKDVVKELESLGKGLRDWNGFVQVIQAWLAGQGVNKLQVGSGTLNAADADKLRRLVLGMYLQNGQQSQGKYWLQTQMKQGNSQDTDWLKRDMAWYLANSALAMNVPNMRMFDIQNAFNMALDGAELSPNTEEGVGALRAAMVFYMADPRKAPNHDLEGLLTSLTHSPFTVEAKQMLTQYYEYIGDQIGLKSLKDQKD